MERAAGEYLFGDSFLNSLAEFLCTVQNVVKNQGALGIL